MCVRKGEGVFVCLTVKPERAGVAKAEMCACARREEEGGGRAYACSGRDGAREKGEPSPA